MKDVDWDSPPSKTRERKGKKARKKATPAPPEETVRLRDLASPETPATTPPEPENTDFERDRSFRVKRYGRLDDTTLEALLVSAFVMDEQADVTSPGTDLDKEADTVFGSPVRGNWFTNSFLGTVFDTLRDAYRERRERRTPTEISNFIAGGQGQTADQSDQFRDEIMECLASRLLHHARAEYLVDEMIQRYRTRKADELYRKYVKDRSDPKIGPAQAVDKFRESCMNALASQSGGAIEVHDWIGDYEGTVDFLRDMKKNPEKYAGFNCGIDAVDKATKGFRPGQLTVFVGMHGGFKSTMMLNVAYGLWKNKYDVLYASLEMEPALMKIKLWCRATRSVSFSRLYAGLVSEGGDWERLEEIKGELSGADLAQQERERLSREKERLENVLVGARQGREDMSVIDEHYRKFQDSPNKLFVISSGQSNKIKGSQIRSWLDEMEGVFRPSVLIVDYLDLVAPENPYPERPDRELGDICKYFRQMGQQLNMSVVTAAQFKRGTIDRMRKLGLDSPEKAQFGTDDIAGSHMIGADADNVIMLFREDGGNRLKLFTAKTRYGMMDVDKGRTLQVDPDTCTIQGSDDIEDTSIRASQISVKEGIESMSRTGQDRDVTPDTMEESEYVGPRGADDILDGFASLMFDDENDGGDELSPNGDELDL